jgi:hypothetical protein
LLGCKSLKPIRISFSGDLLEQNDSNYTINYSSPIAIPFVQQNRNVQGIIGEQTQKGKSLSLPLVKKERIHLRRSHKAIVHLFHPCKKVKAISEKSQETFNTLGIVFFVLALLSFFIILNAAAFAFLFITSILAILSLLFSLIGMGSKEPNKNDNRSTGIVFTILSILLLVISKLISTVAQYP